ncbi:MAG: tRNA pseudouridine(55) synthase TruB [Gammaproteobacteria bacterium]|nr:tRNA pseudouridine(55) synthase TruB [Gammaproteobacteria bacterium]
MGRRRQKGRDVQGILLLDKPLNISSNDALQVVKRLYQARKAGHTGSLDKLASGLLPICLGEATKISGFLLNADKHYLATFKLGIKTSTGDGEGEVLETRSAGDVEPAVVERVFSEFTGPIEQIPPMHSAIKHKGKPLYKLAHQGIEVERKPRPVNIHLLNLLRFAGDDLDVEVRCSKGTYIRTLAEDIGEVLECGAHVSALRRIGSGPYDQPGMVTLDELQECREDGLASLDDLLLPAESAVAAWPDVRLTEDMAYYIRQGQAVMVPRAPTSGWVRLSSGKHGFLGVGEVLDDGKIAPRRLLKA